MSETNTAPTMTPLQAAKVDHLRDKGMTVAGQDEDGTVRLTGKGDGCTVDRFGRVRWAAADVDGQHELTGGTK